MVFTVVAVKLNYATPYRWSLRTTDRMGLDHWLEFRSPEEDPEERGDVVIQWRKWHEIHTFIEALWRIKTRNRKDMFNMILFELDAETWATVKNFIKVAQISIYADKDEEFAKEWIAENEEAIRKIDLEMENHPYMKLYYNSWW